MSEDDISGYLSSDEIILLLQFFQDDTISLKQDRLSTSILKRLPFFKTFKGTFVSLENAESVYVISEGLPTDECDVWMQGNNCLFLAPNPKLDHLYDEVLNVSSRTHADCYINFIFPKFPSLKEETRMLHLNYVRRFLLAPFFNEDQHTRVLQSLKTLEFIPDTNGSLRTASYFYDPRVKVFAVMLPRDAKPPEPFNEKSGWLDLLCKVGLKRKVSRDQFLEFSKEVAKHAENMSKKTRSTLEEKSQTLVTHLLNEKSFHEAEFLRQLSMIKFVASSKASDNLLSLYKQYPCAKQVQDGTLPFIHFHGSISKMEERLVWTTAPLLPDWAVPNAEEAKLGALGVLPHPSLDQVINHVTTLSQNVLKDIDREIPEQKRRLLGDIMTEVYTFLRRISGCQESDSLNSCSLKCHEIGKRLSDKSCVLVEDGRVFVRGDQLAFHLDKQLAPYLYKVPLEYGYFQHLLLRLGAVEEATPEQFAKVLSNLNASCSDEKMHPNESSIAKHAVYGLFTTLKALQGDINEGEPANNSLSNIERLYLPSRKQKLERSVDLVLFDSPGYISRIPIAMYKHLDLLKEYNLTFATPRQIVDLLPAHLTIPSITALVREELHLGCREKKCRADVEKKCHETNRLRHILFSPKFVDGMIRILKYQFQKAKLNDEVRGKVRRFQNELKISCMEMLATELVENRSNTPISGSQRSKKIDCFVERDEGGIKHIFIKHGVDPRNVRRVLCKEINQLTGCYIDKDSWLYLADILECESPEYISSTLDKAGVSEDVDTTDTPNREPDLGTEVPGEFHHLLEQYGDFYFRKGEFVAYEKDDFTEEEPKYIYAKIVNKVTTKTKPKKDRTKRKQKEESKLLDRYLIDVGHVKKEVDVLDLYKIRRRQTVKEKDDEAEEECFSETTELVPHQGTDRQDTEPEGTGCSTTPQSKEDCGEQPKPRTLDAATREVRKKLAEIWKLPEDKRKKAMKRLYLRWHPDKNMDMQDIANEVMKFIQNEVERLSKGKSSSRDEGYPRPSPPDFSDFFKRWNERARRQRSSYDNYRRHNPRFTGFASHSRRTYTAPNPRVAKMWIRQSKEDLRSVKLLLTARNPLYYLVCFQCHQIAEKSLKAALYALSGVADRQLKSHDLVLLANDLSLLPGAPDVTPQVAKLSDYYGGTRYPNGHMPAKVPAEVFQDSQQAQEAFRLATEVLELLEQFVGP